jgi:hypothetical protein
MRKKILFITVAELFTESLGGSVLRGTSIVDYLSEDNDVYVINITDKDASKSKHIRKRKDNHIHIKYSTFGYFLFSIPMYLEAVKLLKQHKFDVICAFFAQSGLYGLLLSKKFNIPVVYFSENVEYQKYIDFGKNDFRRFLLLPYIYWIEKISCSYSNLIVTNNEEDAEIYEKWVRKGRLIVILNGFDADDCNPFYAKKPNDRPTVLFFGHYRHLPNLDAVYITRDKILPKVVEKIPNVLFQFVGADAPTDVKHPNMQFTGFVDDISKYICEADLIIVPIKRGTGMKTKVVYSLGFGKTIISTKEGVRGFRKKYQNLHVAKIEEFPSKICELLNNPPNIDNRDAEEIYQDFAIQSTFPKLEAEIENIISNK